MNNSPYYVRNDSILCRFNPTFRISSTIAIVYDRETNTLLKVGAISDTYEYYETMCSQYLKHGLCGVANSIRFVTLGAKGDGVCFTLEEICTLVNWFQNSGTDINSIIDNPDMTDVRNKIKHLQELGF